MRSELLNGGAYCRTARVLGNTTAETEQDGAWINRELADVGMALSAKLVINYSAVLADTSDTLTAAVQFQDATDSAGTGVADYEDAVAATVVETANSGGETVTGTIEVDIDLSGAEKFVRAQITLVGLAGGTVAYSAIMVLFGDHRQPSTQAIATLDIATAI
ncbi:MAG: hypothetical protein ACYCZ0_00185 [Minisyncoccota bacterium]